MPNTNDVEEYRILEIAEEGASLETVMKTRMAGNRKLIYIGENEEGKNR